MIRSTLAASAKVASRQRLTFFSFIGWPRHPCGVPISDLDRIEDIAASATMAGVQAALGLADLDLSDTSLATHLSWIAKVLTSDALYDEASLAALAEFERELQGLVNREVDLDCRRRLAVASAAT